MWFRSENHERAFGLCFSEVISLGVSLKPVIGGGGGTDNRRKTYATTVFLVEYLRARSITFFPFFFFFSVRIKKIRRYL